MSVVLVTGASAGFGKAICQKLIADGFSVIGTARRLDKLQELQKELGDKFLPLQLDVTDLTAIEALPGKIPPSFQPIDILINNAGLALGLEPANEVPFQYWDTMVHTNILGLIKLTHTLLPEMVKRNHGYIINLGSIAGTYPYKGGNVYGATKAFVRQFSLNLRTDLLGKKIRVTNIEPGLCGGTEFSNVRFGDDKKAAEVYTGVDFVTAGDIANTISWLISMPEHFNVNSIEIMPTAQAPAGMSVAKNM
ncbi:SDR family NAD(P)-dependent oxidoreductase [Zophobihabitans entericus]|uniref:SDR family NAD(P)-dependent oxidoreductase n=1 Tax=Zophobihabitans entericus TaxID=1635327 RepID=A0A6G9I9F3_9GAMM|nr:SDR family NAD(P)-dependent oxidoreductase [Zophobihabitans entericus]QIQ20846.1 SDR family NAD(P)-dependent oxidoreductase [Zophobihabitans entericus]